MLRNPRHRYLRTDSFEEPSGRYPSLKYWVGVAAMVGALCVWEVMHPIPKGPVAKPDTITSALNSSGNGSQDGGKLTLEQEQEARLALARRKRALQLQQQQRQQQQQD
jgi:hypothetical protein